MISIVMPAHNEQAYLKSAVETVLTGMRNRGLAFEILVAENGSTDSTVAEAEKLAVEHPEVIVLTSGAADYGRALRAGFLAARGEAVVNFDVDLVDLSFLDGALALMSDSRVDVVIGTKRGSGADDRRGWARKLVTACFSAVMRVGFGLRASDTHGLKALRREPVLPLVEVCRFDSDIFDTELVLRAERAGLEVRELPVTVEERRPPRTSLWGRVLRSGPNLARLRWVLWRSGTS